MLNAKQTREVARIALKGKFGTSIAAGLVFSLLTGGAYSLVNFRYSRNIDLNADTFGGKAGELPIPGTFSDGEFSESFFAYLQRLFTETVFGKIAVAALVFILLIALIYAAAVFVFSGPLTAGYSRFNLNLVDGQPTSVGQIFGEFHRFKTMLGAWFLRWFYLFLWNLPGFGLMLLGTYGFFVFASAVHSSRSLTAILISCSLFIAGYVWVIVSVILKSLAYSQAFFVLVELPECGANEAICRSKQMMQGQKGKLFCLEISFIGWLILAAFTAGIGMLFLTPYIKAAEAVFYRDLTVCLYADQPDVQMEISGQNNPT